MKAEKARDSSADTPASTDALGLSIILKRYGLFGLEDAGAGTLRTDDHVLRLEETGILRAGRTDDLAPLHLDVQEEPADRLLWKARPRFWEWRRRPAFHALLPHISFSGDGLTPLWVTQSGRCVLGWFERAGHRQLLCGVPVVAEMVRRLQGDPEAVHSGRDRSCWGFSFERPVYLYEGQVRASLASIPWADVLGFTLAELLAELTGMPLIEPLPEGVRGAVMITGDDDEAYLEKYAEQLAFLGNVPITYFLLPRTRHDRQSLERLPATVEFGLHVDALDTPDQYAQRCAEQLRAVADLTGRPIRSIRNHGFLSDGYQGHLAAWEQCGLELDVNLPGVGGTALNGSFLPMRVRRADGIWSSHYTLLTAFGDGMLSLYNLSPGQGRRRIRALARQIERSSPGIIVVNFHPQNITPCRALHREVLCVLGRRGWSALGAESFLTWLKKRDALSMCRVAPGEFELRADGPVEGIAVRVLDRNGWRHIPVPALDGGQSYRLSALSHVAEAAPRRTA